MKKFNSYWPIYKNLESETLQLAKYIEFSDNQLGVYSMHIADLIMRIVVEIESISKELYNDNGGPEVKDENGKPRDLFFDTDCINFLNDKWNICDREIIVSCANFNLTDEKYKLFKPLKKANKRGSSSAKWNRAYQAVKHDRRNNLSKGNIENLIGALGALYILNIYYKDEVFEYGTNSSPNDIFDNRLGSDIFAATFADASNIPIGVVVNDDKIQQDEKEKIPTALCIVKYKDDSISEMQKELIAYNSSARESVINDPNFLKELNKRVDNIDNVQEITTKLFKEMQSDYVSKNPPMKFGNMIMNAKKEVVLNKNQRIYNIN